MIRPEDATSEALRKCSSYQVGNGNHVALWNDAWLGDKPLRDQFPRLYKISSSPCALFQIWESGCMHGSLVLECILAQKLESF